MERNGKHAVVYLRMSPQLRDAVRAAADGAGCSLNAFAVQVLAAAAGDPARFRAGTAPASSAAPVEESNVRVLARDHLGYPLDLRERFDHSAARGEFIAVMVREIGSSAMVALVRRLDAEDPAYFVEWERLRRDEERAGRGSEDRRGAA